MSNDDGLTITVLALVAWPLIASSAAAALGLERGQRRAVMFCIGAGVLSFGTGLIFDLQSVAAGESSAVGGFMISYGLALTPPAVAAALARRPTTPAPAWSWPGVWARAWAAYGILCVSLPVAILVGFVVGAATCRGSCL